MVTENGFTSRSSSYDSDASSTDSSGHILESEVDAEQNSDSSCNNTSHKTSTKSNNSNEEKKFFNSSDSIRNDNVVGSKFSTRNSNQFQKNLNDESLEQSAHCLMSCSPKGIEKSMSRIKRENPKTEFSYKGVDIHNKITESFPIIEDTRLNRYTFETETKNFKSDVDKFKRENEDNCIKPLDKSDVHNSAKRSTSANNSPYKEKRRKLFFEKMETNQELFDQGTVRSELQKPVVTKIYYSYFERGSDDKDEIREIK